LNVNFSKALLATRFGFRLGCRHFRYKTSSHDRAIYCEILMKTTLYRYQVSIIFRGLTLYY